MVHRHGHATRRHAWIPMRRIHERAQPNMHTTASKTSDRTIGGNR